MDTIFHFNNPTEYLNHILLEKKRKNPRYSIRSWSKQLGYENPAFLAQVLKGQRKLKPDLGQKISEHLKLSQDEKKYFDGLILIANAKNEAETELFLKVLEQIRPNHKVHSVALDLFRYIADWYHLAILEMLSLKNFNSDPSEISRQLGGEPNSQTVAVALERLKRLKLIKEVNGVLKRVNNKSLLIDFKIPSEAIRKHHSQMIEKALTAIDQQNISERNLNGSTLTIKYEDYDKAIDVIKKCHHELLKLAKAKDGDCTYQFNTQFFKLTSIGGVNEKFNN